ncbi:hypothetical protein D3C86_1925180 [compost metagenome]
MTIPIKTKIDGSSDLISEPLQLLAKTTNNRTKPYLKKPVALFPPAERLSKNLAIHPKLK